MNAPFMDIYCRLCITSDFPKSRVCDKFAPWRVVVAYNSVLRAVPRHKNRTGVEMFSPLAAIFESLLS
jgi:hypothetical protein